MEKSYVNNSRAFASKLIVRVLFTFFLLAFSRFVHTIFAVPKNLRSLPRVSTWSLLKSYLASESDDVRIKRLLLPFADRGEPVVLVWVLGIWTVHILDEKVCSLILPPICLAYLNPKSALSVVKDVQTFPKELPSRDFLFWRLLGPTSLISTNGEAWRKNSLIIREGFKDILPIPTLVKLSRCFTEIVSTKLEYPVNVSDLAHRFTLDAVSSTIIGHDFDVMHQDSEFVSKYNSIMNEIANPLYIFFPKLERIFPRTSLANRIDSLGDDVLALFESKRARPGNDIMSAIMDHPDMTDQDKRDNFLTLIFGGHVSNS